MKKYNSRLEISFTVNHDNIDSPRNAEIIAGLEYRLEMLKAHPDEIKESYDGLYDTVENK